MSLASGFTDPNIRFANMCLYRFLCFFLFPNKTFQVEEKAGPLERSILYMKSNIDKKLTADDIATHIQYSPSHFTARFKQKTGMAPIDYFIKLKIQYACQLLSQNGIKIKEVAGKIGYDDPYYFSRLFKKVTGKSPKHYRIVRGADNIKQR
jgi:YesN/AraC family two-component response regulator